MTIAAGFTPTQPAPFEVGALETRILADPASYAAQFRERPAWAFDSVVEPGLLDRLVRGAERADFYEKVFDTTGVRGVEQTGRVGPACAVLFNRRSLLDWLAAATGISGLHSVQGSLANSAPGSGQALTWHDDLIVPQRRLGFVLNLSTGQHEGGDFEIRRKGETEPFLRFHHTVPGSITLLAVRNDLEHRVTPVTGGDHRRVYVGWFLGD